MTLSAAASDSKAGSARQYDPCRTILPFLWVVMLIVALPVLIARDEPAPPAPTTTYIGVDPNAAPWWELTILPRIGDGIAREIVRYRESMGKTSSAGGEPPVFAAAADLMWVRGIGPKTLQRIGPYLRFQRPSIR